MKAILLIDVPEGYETEDLLIDYCLHTKGEYRSIRKSGNNPLKPLPQKLDANDWHRMFSGLFSEREAKGYGWNACLEEITDE